MKEKHIIVFITMAAYTEEELIGSKGMRITSIDKLGKPQVCIQLAFEKK
jgi:hypothetical protein